MPHHIYIARRDFSNMVLYYIYRFFRVILIAGWFYFLPFVIMFASYIIPAYHKNSDPKPATSTAGDTSATGEF